MTNSCSQRYTASTFPAPRTAPSAKFTVTFQGTHVIVIASTLSHFSATSAKQGSGSGRRTCEAVRPSWHLITPPSRTPHCGSIRLVRAENSADRRAPVAGHSNKDGKWLQRRNSHRDGTRSSKVPRTPKRRPSLNRRPRAVIQADFIKTTSQTQVKLQPAKERLRMPGTFKLSRRRKLGHCPMPTPVTAATSMGTESRRSPGLPALSWPGLLVLEAISYLERVDIQICSAPAWVHLGRRLRCSLAGLRGFGSGLGVARLSCQHRERDTTAQAGTAFD